VIRVVIVIPAYNSASTIGETLRSIAACTADPSLTAVYLADDASTDDTCKVAEAAWTGNVPLIVRRAEKNSGERRTVNRMFSEIAAECDWALILHADDLAKPDWLVTMVRLMKQAGERTASVCSSYDLLHEGGRIEAGEEIADAGTRVIEGNSAAVVDTLIRGCWWHISGCAIRLSAFKAIGGFHEEMPQRGDWEWLLRALSKGYAIEYAPRTLTLYRLHGASVSSVSFRTFRDVRETLDVLRLYREALPRRLQARLYWQNEMLSLRRGARAITRADAPTTMNSLKAAGLVIRHFADAMARG
jgi:glycosyltransferase involved in cell wall biosynthesis